MKLNICSYGFSVVPENASDLLYLRSLGIGKPGDILTLRLITVCLDEGHPWQAAADIGQVHCVELATEGVVRDVMDHPDAEGIPDDFE